MASWSCGEAQELGSQNSEFEDGKGSVWPENAVCKVYDADFFFGRRRLAGISLLCASDKALVVLTSNGEIPVSLAGRIANPTTRRFDFCSLVLSQLDSKLQ
jgi:hypothetical protein